MKKLNFSQIGERLNKAEMKKIMAGSGPGDICLGCGSDSECAQVNKGKCVYAYCNNKQAYWCDMS